MSIVEIGLPGGFAANAVLTAGAGPPVVYLHGPFGQEPLSGFLADLTGDHQVWAPAHPGGEDPADLERLDHLYDLLLYYDDLFEALELETFDLVGHSFGAMVAAELAAGFRHRVQRLVLLAPLGLWRDDAPVADYVVLPHEEQRALLFHDPASPAAQAAFVPPLGPSDDGPEAAVRRLTAIASTSHFVWPIPERGLAKRLRRIEAPTLLVWGRQDAVVDVAYAADFAASIDNASVRVVDGAGHYPHVEEREQVAEATLAFLREH
jgi:pimeloyl-ACP methyl ester carboxylesterase